MRARVSVRAGAVPCPTNVRSRARSDSVNSTAFFVGRMRSLRSGAVVLSATRLPSRLRPRKLRVTAYSWCVRAESPVAGRVRRGGGRPAPLLRRPAVAYPYRVALTEEQRAHLRGLVGAGVASARMLARARIRLDADHGAGGPG